MADWMWLRLRIGYRASTILKRPSRLPQAFSCKSAPTGAPRATQFGSGWRFVFVTFLEVERASVRWLLKWIVWWPLVQIHHPHSSMYTSFLQWYPNGSINNLEGIWWMQLHSHQVRTEPLLRGVSGLLSYVDGALNVGGHCCLSLIRSALPRQSD